MMGISYFFLSPVKSSLVANPKSPIFSSMFSFKNRFPNFKSRWMILCSWRCLTPDKSWYMKHLASGSVMAFLRLCNSIRLWKESRMRTFLDSIPKLNFLLVVCTTLGQCRQSCYPRKSCRTQLHVCCLALCEWKFLGPFCPFDEASPVAVWTQSCQHKQCL